MEDKSDNRETIVDDSWSYPQQNLQIKICPTCKKSYPDTMTSFCLEDGELLVTATITLPTESEKTLVLGKNK